MIYDVTCEAPRAKLKVCVSLKAGARCHLASAKLRKKSQPKKTFSLRLVFLT